MPHRLFLLLTICLLHASAWGAESLVTVASPRGPGITQSYLWTIANESIQPRNIFLLFPGYPSVMNLRQEEGGVIKFELGGNFLIRARKLFAGSTDAAASLDAPSDERTRFEDNFRTSTDPAQDIAAVINNMKQRYPQARIVAVGNSASTTGVAHLARNLPGNIDAVALTATVTVSNTKAGMWGLGSFDFGQIRQPLLFAHHIHDTCDKSPYDRIQKLNYPLITVIGQDPPKSAPCQAKNAHGFWGRDEQVVEAIRAWVEGKAFPTSID